MKDGELRSGAHSWDTSELESESFAARTPADVVNIPALGHRNHLRRANQRRVQPLQEGGERSSVEFLLCQTMKAPSLGLRDKNR